MIFEILFFCIVVSACGSGFLEIFNFDGATTEPTLIYQTNLNEAITGMDLGMITNTTQDEIAVSTYSGKILAFSTYVPVRLLLGVLLRTSVRIQYQGIRTGQIVVFSIDGKAVQAALQATAKAVIERRGVLKHSARRLQVFPSTRGGCGAPEGWQKAPSLRPRHISLHSGGELFRHAADHSFQRQFTIH